MPSTTPGIVASSFISIVTVSEKPVWYTAEKRLPYSSTSIVRAEAESWTSLTPTIAPLTLIEQSLPSVMANGLRLFEGHRKRDRTVESNVFRHVHHVVAAGGVGLKVRNEASWVVALDFPSAIF